MPNTDSPIPDAEVRPRRNVVLGHVDPYDPSVEPFQNYLDRLEAFFELNDAAESEKVNSLVVLMGREMHSVLKNLVAPDKPTSKTFEELCAVLREHYAPEGIEVAERYKFHCRHQAVNESSRDFVVAIKNLASSCNFGEFLDQALRDQLVFGIRDPVVKKKLLSERTLTFQNAVKIVSDMELVMEQSKVMDSVGQQLDDVHQLKPKPSGGGKPKQMSQDSKNSPTTTDKSDNTQPQHKTRRTPQSPGERAKTLQSCQHNNVLDFKDMS